MQYFPVFLPLSDLLRSLANDELVGPLGLEPRTKGFTSAPPFPEGVDYLFTPVGCGTLLPVIKRDLHALR